MIKNRKQERKTEKKKRIGRKRICHLLLLSCTIQAGNGKEGRKEEGVAGEWSKGEKRGEKYTISKCIH